MATIEESDDYFGDNFGQKVDLTVRLREILKNYPEGSTVLKELVQNADDAGASKIVFCLDRRTHPSQKLPYSKLKDFQGPSLLAFNDAVFTAADFQSIQRIGGSLKAEASEGVKTGKFGIGFNSVYHLTDLPTFVSGERMVLFDPQAAYLPGVDPTNPGKMINFLQHKEILDKYPDHFKPYIGFGLKFDEEYKGTLFRFPLRTPSQAEISSISKKSHSVEAVAELLTAFVQEAALCLIFIRNIGSITVSEWREGEVEPTELYTASIQTPSAEVREKRRFLAGLDQAAIDHGPTEGVECDYELRLALSGPAVDAETQRWLVCNHLKPGLALRRFGSLDSSGLRLVGWGGVAARLDAALKPEGTAAFCSLPLPLRTSLPVQVNAFFEISSNRRDIWYGGDMVGIGRLRSEWNQALLQEPVAESYVRLLEKASRLMGQPWSKSYDLWPSKQQGIWSFLVSSVYKLIESRKVLCLNPEESEPVWEVPARCIFVSMDIPSYGQLAEILRGQKIKAVKMSSSVLEVMLKECPKLYSLNPALARSLFRSLKADPRFVEKHQLSLILQYCLSDVPDGNYKDIDGLPLVPLATGKCGRFVMKRRNAEPMASGKGEGTLCEVYSLPTKELFLMFPREVMRSVIDIEVLEEPEVFAPTLEILQRSTFQSNFNVTGPTIRLIKDLVLATMGSHWPELDVIPQADIGSLSACGTINAAWFFSFWAYLGKSNLEDFSSLFSIGPLLPTMHDTIIACHPIAPIGECVTAGGCRRYSTAVLATGEHISLMPILSELGLSFVDSSVFKSFAALETSHIFVNDFNASGVLSCLVASARRQKIEVEKLISKLTVQERDLLRAFIIRDFIERQSVVKREEHKVLRTLPLFPLYASEDCTSHSHHSEPFECLEDSLSNKGKPASIVFSVISPEMVLTDEDIDPKALDCRILYLSDHLERHFVSKTLGVPCISPAEAYSRYFFPKIKSLREDHRDEVILRLLHTISMDSNLFRHLKGQLQELYFVPRRDCPEDLGRCCDFFDPSVPELMELLEKRYFPTVMFSTPPVLEVLRLLGMKSAFGPEDVLRVARDIEAKARDLEARSTGITPEEFRELASSIKNQAQGLLNYLDLTFEQLILAFQGDKNSQATETSQNNGRKLLQSVRHKAKLLQNFLGIDATNGDSTQSTEKGEGTPGARLSSFVHTLKTVSWIPIQTEEVHPLLPMLHGENADLNVRLPIVANAVEVRPAEDLWLCSASAYLLDGAVFSDKLRMVLGWSHKIKPSIVASQICAIATRACQQLESGSRDELLRLISARMGLLYARLSDCLEDHPELQVVQEILFGRVWVWTGSSFVSVSEVAFEGMAEAQPYLYQVPPEIASFRPLLRALGVREAFGVSDYVSVLEKMFNASESIRGVPPNPIDAALSSRDLELAVQLVQKISDQVDLIPSTLTLYVPDSNGVMCSAQELCFNDAPWILASEQTPRRTQHRLVHPKISASVGERLGMKSLRSRMVLTHTTPLSQGSQRFEAFGQSEKITRRLSHVLELYPDGPSIIHELIQNADDAGASTVKIVLNTRKYGTSTLISSEMKKFQGAALYFFNDAVFSDNDLRNLSWVGQGSKLNRLDSVGRFGLGFNAIYHFTDLPSFVSGDNLVFLDPHGVNVPGASGQKPGVKIRFAESQLRQEFPDQFEPFLLFGCDMTRSFQGTLFRFPFRTPRVAAESEIKAKEYSPSDAMALFFAFTRTLEESLLFLRNVKTVEAYVVSDHSKEPRLLFRAGRSRDTHMDPVSAFFLDNQGNPLGREAFFSKLKATPETRLPKIYQEFRINCAVAKILRSELGAKGVVPGVDEVCTSLQDEHSSTYSFHQNLFGLYTKLTGGKARQMASDQSASSKLVPLCSVACKRLAGSSHSQAIKGRAFSYLPLPIFTGLPVHVNAFFEVTSNRRDLWLGEDMSGEGHQRSLWNQTLLEEVVAQAYLELLALRRSAGDRAYDLWPGPKILPPWDRVERCLYHTIGAYKVFPGPDGYLYDLNQVWLSEPSCKAEKDIKRIVTAQGFTVVQVPEKIHIAMTTQCPDARSLSPPSIRRSIKEGILCMNLGQAELLHVLAFCLSDLHDHPNCLEELDGLAILPLIDGSVGMLKVLDQADKNSKVSAELYYLCDAEETKLLQEVVGSVVAVAPPVEFSSLETVALSQHTNLLRMGPRFLSDILRREVQTDDASREPELNLPETHPIRLESWNRTLWHYILRVGGLECFEGLPVLLGKKNGQICPFTLRMYDQNLPPSRQLIYTGGLDQETSLTFQKLGLWALVSLDGVLAPTLGASENSEITHLPPLLRHAVAGISKQSSIIRALSNVVVGVTGAWVGDADSSVIKEGLAKGEAAFDGLTPSERTNLRLVLLRVFMQSEKDPEDWRRLSYLPIFKTYGQQFKALATGLCLPPNDVPPSILDDNFLMVTAEEKEVLEKMGTRHVRAPDFYVQHFLPRISTYPADIRDEGLVHLLSQLHQADLDEELMVSLSQTSCIPTAEADRAALDLGDTVSKLCKPSELFDPEEKNLMLFLGPSSYPSKKYRDPAVLEAMRKLGLRNKLSLNAILSSAEEIPELLTQDKRLTFARAKKLQEFLERKMERDRDDSLPSLPPHDESLNVAELCQRLRDIPWMAVLTLPPHVNLPWPEAAEPLEAPANCRQKQDMWLCSYTRRFPESEITSPELVKAFGWAEPVSSAVVAQQLVRLSDIHQAGGGPGLARTLTDVLPRIYSNLDQSEDLGDIQKILDGKAWIWVGKKFVKRAQVARFAPPRAEPYLYCWPEMLQPFKRLYEAFGIKETFSNEDLSMFIRSDLPQEGRLSDDQLALMIALLNLLDPEDDGSNTWLQHITALPSADGSMEPVSRLTYNDAAWLSDNERLKLGCTFVHNKINLDFAAAVGCQSLRKVIVEMGNATFSIGCPDVTSLVNIFQIFGRDENLVAEILEVAEQFQCQSAELLWDQRSHPYNSLLSASMKELQGPSLSIYLPSCDLHLQDITWAMKLQGWSLETPPGRRSEAFMDTSRLIRPGLGPGLAACFRITDCLQILTGGFLFLFDPSGEYLEPKLKSDSANEGSTVSREPLARYYHLATSQICSRFPDQFKPFTDLVAGWTPGDDCKLNGTIIRMPLRRKEGPLQTKVWDEQAVEHLIAESSRVLFTLNLERVTMKTWRTGEKEPILSFDVLAHLSQSTRSQKFRTISSNSWRKSNLATLFQQRKPSQDCFKLEVSVYDGVESVLDTWLIAHAMTCGEAREYALARSYSTFGLKPFVAVAAHILRNGKIFGPVNDGRICYTLPGTYISGLPVHINGNFLLFPSDRGLVEEIDIPGGAQDNSRTRWNEVLFREGVPLCYVDILESLKTILIRDHRDNLEALYHFWPSLGSISPPLKNWVQSALIPKLSDASIFLSTAGTFGQLQEGLMRDRNIVDEIVKLLAAHKVFFFDVPITIQDDLQTCQVRTFHRFTPTIFRSILRQKRQDVRNHVMRAYNPPRDIIIDLWRFCTSDQDELPGQSFAIDPRLSYWQQFKGLPLLPLASGDIDFLGTSPSYYGDGSYSELLTKLHKRFIAVEFCEAFPSIFTDHVFKAIAKITAADVRLLADQLATQLPKEWYKATFISRSDDSQFHEVSESWIRAFWKVVNYDSAETIDLFGDWPLIPVEDGLVSCSLRKAVLAFERRMDSSRTSQDDGNSSRATSPIDDGEFFHQLCRTMGIPLLALDYFEEPQGFVSSAAQASRKFVSCIQELERVGASHLMDWSKVPAAQRFDLLHRLAKDMEQHGSLSFMERRTVCTFPIFPKLSGSSTSVVGEFFYLAQNIEPLLLECFSLDLSAPALIAEPDLQLLYNDIGIKQMDSVGLLQRFILPAFHTYDVGRQKNLMDYIVSQWRVLRQEQSFLEAVYSTPIVPVQGSLRLCSDLHDPQLGLLKEVLGEEEALFPPTDLRSGQFLDVFRELGMKTAIDAKTFLLCARKVDSLAENAVFEARSKAILLIRHLSSNVGAYSSPSLCRDLAELRVAPCITYSDPRDGVSPLRPTPSIAKFCEAVIDGDKYLAWTVNPILEEGATPPQLMWDHLGLRSPPSLTLVMEHLHNITRRNDQRPPLWPLKDVFTAIFRYLDGKLDTLSQEHLEKLSGLPIVPIDDTVLVKPDRLFIKLKRNLSPFLFEIPRVFGSFDNLLHRLGARREPSVDVYRDILFDIKKGVAEEPLNLNEALAVIHILELIIEDPSFESKVVFSKGKITSNQLLAPDSCLVLRDAAMCLYNDAPWVLRSVRLPATHTLSEVVPKMIAEKLGIPPVSSVITEVLESKRPATDMRDEELQLNRSLKSSVFLEGLAKAVQTERKRAMTGKSFLAGGLAEPDGFADYETAVKVCENLSDFSVSLLDELKTRFFYSSDSDLLVDVTDSSCAQSNLTYFDQSSKCIYIAARNLPSHISLNRALALSLKRVLANGVSDSGLIEALLEVSEVSAEAVNAVLVAHGYYLTDNWDIKSRPFPRLGDPISPDDQGRLELTPTHTFMEGEIVLWKDNRTDALRYGAVISSKETNDQALIPVLLIRTGRTSTSLFKSTELYSLRRTETTRGLSALVSGNPSPATVPALGFEHFSENVTAPSSADMKNQELLPHLHSTVVGPKEVLSACNDLLAKAGLTLQQSSEQMLAELLTLRQEVSNLRGQNTEQLLKISKLHENQNRWRSALCCQICFLNTVNRLIVPCGHLLCSECLGQISTSIRRKRCPFCRADVTSSAVFSSPLTMAAEEDGDD